MSRRSPLILAFNFFTHIYSEHKLCSRELRACLVLVLSFLFTFLITSNTSCRAGGFESLCSAKVGMERLSRKLDKSEKFSVCLYAVLVLVELVKSLHNAQGVCCRGPTCNLTFREGVSAGPRCKPGRELVLSLYLTPLHLMLFSALAVNAKFKICNS